ncbi:MAG: hypothetical protein IPK67_18060 [Planctomycetes bacterium]|nr:hypothetical protein [Planctomycetota bacterium]
MLRILPAAPLRALVVAVACGLLALWFVRLFQDVPSRPLSARDGPGTAAEPSEGIAQVGSDPRGAPAPPGPGESRPLEVPGAPGAPGIGAGLRSPEPASPGRDCELTLVLSSGFTALAPIAVDLRREAPDGDGTARAQRQVTLRDRRAVGGLAPGIWRVACRERNWRGEEQSLELDLRNGAASLELPFEPVGPWVGRALDADTGLPLARATLVLESRGVLGGESAQGELGRRELVLPDGGFAVGCGAVPGNEARLCITAEGYEALCTPWIPWDGSVRVDLGDLALLRAGLAGGGLAGRVIDADTGAALAGVRVVAVDVRTRPEDLWTDGFAISGAEPLEGRSALTDPSGEFALGLRGPDPVRLVAFRSSHGMSLGEPVIRAPGARLLLARRSLLRGRVLADEGVRGAAVLQSVLVSGEGPSVCVPLNADLEFELGGLAGGRWRVALQGFEVQAGGQSVLAELLVEHVELREGEVQELTLRYPPVSSEPGLLGRVLLPEGVSFSLLRAALWLPAESGPSRFAAVDSAGDFSLPGPLPRAGRLFVGGSSQDQSRAFVVVLAWDETRPLGALAVLDVREPALRGEARRDGVPAARCGVLVAARSGDAFWTQAVAEGLDVTTDEQGRFTLYGLAPGTYEIGRLGGSRRTVEVDPLGGPAPELVLE